MKPLRSKFRSRDVWEIPTLILTPLWLYEGEAQRSGMRELWESMDEEGMRNPIIAAVMTPDYWARRIARRKQKVDFAPILLFDKIILAVLIGNQRLAYARWFDYTHVSTVLCATEEGCIEWQKANLDQAP